MKIQPRETMDINRAESKGKGPERVERGRPPQREGGPPEDPGRASQPPRTFPETSSEHARKLSREEQLFGAAAAPKPSERVILQTPAHRPEPSRLIPHPPRQGETRPGFLMTGPSDHPNRVPSAADDPFSPALPITNTTIHNYPLDDFLSGRGYNMRAPLPPMPGSSNRGGVPVVSITPATPKPSEPSKDSDENPGRDPAVLIPGPYTEGGVPRWIVEPLGKGFWFLVQRFDFRWYAWSIGTGITSILLHALADAYPGAAIGLSWVSVVIFLINVAQFSIILGFTVLRYVKWPMLFWIMIRHHRQAMFIATMPMALGTIIIMCANIVRDQPKLITAIWIF
ncbi:voltage-dependent anion channel-domain-containing protein [Xylariaceae sp. AK1471]|nr:voltage-dependent anion channel-domain-containing protein [Xylariaceae sp. AK1471]